MICPRCNIQMNLLGARGGNANGPTTEVWVCVHCSNLYYQNVATVTNSSGSYTITVPTNTSSAVPYGGYVNAPNYPTFVVDVSSRNYIKPETSPPKNCDLCDELFSNEEEYNKHIEEEHKWIMGKQHEHREGND